MTQWCLKMWGSDRNHILHTARTRMERPISHLRQTRHSVAALYFKRALVTDAWLQCFHRMFPHIWESSVPLLHIEVILTPISVSKISNNPLTQSSRFGVGGRWGAEKGRSKSHSCNCKPSTTTGWSQPQPPTSTTGRGRQCTPSTTGAQWQNFPTN